MADILQELKDHCEELPAEAETHVREFVNDLMDKGLAGYQFQA